MNPNDPVFPTNIRLKNYSNLEQDKQGLLQSHDYENMQTLGLTKRELFAALAICRLHIEGFLMKNFINMSQKSS